MEDVSDDDLYDYFLENVASEDVSEAIDNYVDEKMRREEKNGMYEQRCKRLEAGERIDEEDLSKISAELDKEGAELDRRSAELDRRSAELDKKFEKFKGTAKRAELLAKNAERDCQEYKSWCKQRSKDLKELKESFDKLAEETRLDCGYTQSSHFDAERWQVSIKLAEEAEKRERMKTKRGRVEIEDYQEAEQSQKRAHKKARR